MRDFKFYLEIEGLGVDAENSGPWRCYDSISTEGDSIEELLANAVVFLMDQDGGEAGQERADAPWMEEAIREAFAEKYPEAAEAIMRRHYSEPEAGEER